MGSLELVDLVDANAQPIDGLVPVRGHKLAETPHERAILEQAGNFEHVAYVFFRRFKDGGGKHIRSAQVAAYVVDNSNCRLGESDLAQLHHKLWLHGVAPLVYVAWPTRVDILTCARKPDFWDASGGDGVARYRHAARIESHEVGGTAIKTAAEIKKAFDVRKRFSAFRLAEGTFWDDPENQKLAKTDAAAHRTLIQAIVETDRELDGGRHPVRRRLLVLTVLIKYLEDRAVFPSGHFGRFHAGARSFFDVLKQGTVEEMLRLLRYFENKFNGDVFSLGDDGSKLTTDEMRRFAKLVEAKALGGQEHFWKLFSFEHIPVEVISRLYQWFVTGHGAVYTPSFLATLLLDQVMPYERMTGKETVLDPACGSGVFLVGAFKRLVIHWRSLNRWRKPSAAKLKEILSQSIYGVEIEPFAVDLTAFSLALAVCDALEPPVIWSSLKFDKLRGRNLREGDFFNPATFVDHGGGDWPGKFKVVVGNPPFGSKLTDAARAVEAARLADEPKLPDKQAAYLFLERGLMALTAGGSLCLIQPHGLLYNSKTIGFRRHLMNLSRLSAILDFVSVRGLYEGADPKTIAWLAVREPRTDEPIYHLTFRRTYSASERIAFEIDHYDWHVVSPSEAAHSPFVWRVDLLGGGRLHEFSDRIRTMPTLSSFVTKKGSDWDYGEGFIAGKNGKRVPAPFLTGKPLLPTAAFTHEGIDRGRIVAGKSVVRDVLFKSPYTASRFSPPLILIKAHESLPVEFWNEGFIGYRDKIIGIHAPESEIATLRRVFETIKNHRDLYRFCCSLNGSQALTGKATVPLKQDLDLLPIPDDPSELSLTFWEDALKNDVIVHMSKYIRLGQGSQLLKRAASASDMVAYSAMYVRMLGSVYRDLKRYEPIYLNGLIAQPFYFGDRPDVSWLHGDFATSLHQLIYDETSVSLRTVRVVRHYEGNVILIVKPDRLRYWIRSTAIRDADDTLVNLRAQGW